MGKSVPFATVLNNYLKDPKQAASYLKSTLEENDPVLFLAALRDVAQVQGVVSEAEMSQLSELIESLRRHGVSDEVITAVLADVNHVDAA
jgi:DNA-binding phage protein